uniref:Uncharacterized protein n=1 Tax=Romanomermis culicivorax TaxID=13658 RepID=A0A915JFY9_ROMCU
CIGSKILKISGRGPKFQGYRDILAKPFCGPLEFSASVNRYRISKSKIFKPEVNPGNSGTRVMDKRVPGLLAPENF